MTLQLQIPNVDVIKALDDNQFGRVVCGSLARYDMKSPIFNQAANAKFITPLDATNRAMFFYPEEARDLIMSSLKALKEYDMTGKISQTTREEFILADMKDVLRNVPCDHNSDEYKATCKDVMAYVSSRLTGIGSLALSAEPPASSDVSVSITPAKPSAPGTPRA